MVTALIAAVSVVLAAVLTFISGTRTEKAQREVLKSEVETLVKLQEIDGLEQAKADLREVVERRTRRWARTPGFIPRIFTFAYSTLLLGAGLGGLASIANDVSRVRSPTLLLRTYSDVVMAAGAVALLTAFVLTAVVARRSRAGTR